MTGTVLRVLGDMLALGVVVGVVGWLVVRWLVAIRREFWT